MNGRPHTATNPRGRGRFWNDIRWGSAYSPKALALNGTITPAPFSFQTPGTLVQYDMWPARLVALVGIMTALTPAAWTADLAAGGGPYTLNWQIGIGTGSTREEIIFTQTWSAAPAQLLLLTSSGTPLLLPAKQVTVTATLSGEVKTDASFGVRFAAFAAPYSLGGLGLEEEGGSAG